MRGRLPLCCPLTLVNIVTRHAYTRPSRPFAAIPRQSSRTLLTLAIETSCDDTCVALLEKHSTPGKPVLEIHHHERLTADNTAHRGIHPLVALDSHQLNLATMVQRALAHPCLALSDDSSSLGQSSSTTTATSDRRPDPMLHSPPPPAASQRKPDLISVTRGPGMLAGLNAGLDLAKGLALAWGIPLVGVHHMQAHALTPRLVSASQRIVPAATPYEHNPQNPAADADANDPAFPFLSLLVSGGHTLLIHSKSLTEHTVLADTSDIAAGDALDKVARDILPPSMIARAETTAYGPLLERFAFPAAAASAKYDYAYTPPGSLSASLARYHSAYGWSMQPPLASAKGGAKARSMLFAFSGVASGARSAMARLTTASSSSTSTISTSPSSSSSNSSSSSSSEEEEGEGEEIRARRELAQTTQRLTFEHLTSRTLLALDTLSQSTPPRAPQNLVVSGGVAANKYLRHILRAWLDARGYAGVALRFPPLPLCTDNAIMIGWAGLEMFEAGFRSRLDVQAVRKWPFEVGADSEVGRGRGSGVVYGGAYEGYPGDGSGCERDGRDEVETSAAA